MCCHGMLINFDLIHTMCEHEIIYLHNTYYDWQIRIKLPKSLHIKYANYFQPKFNFLKPHNTRCVAWLTNFLNRTADDNVILTNYLDSKSLCFRHNAKYLCLYIIIRNSHQYFEARESPLSPLTALAFRLMPLQ